MRSSRPSLPYKPSTGGESEMSASVGTRVMVQVFALPCETWGIASRSKVTIETSMKSLESPKRAFLMLSEAGVVLGFFKADFSGLDSIRAGTTAAVLLAVGIGAGS